MSSRHSSASLVLAFLTVGFAVTGGGLAMGACSSETGPADGPTEAGPDASTDARKIVEAAPPEPEEDAATEPTVEQCVAACKAADPTAAMKYDAVDVCWAAKCKGPCVDGTGMFDAGDAGDDADAGDPDAGDAGDGGPTRNDGGTDLCTGTYSSGTDKACDDCTEAFCCPAWDGCYNNPDCQEYNDCVGNCF